MQITNKITKLFVAVAVSVVAIGMMAAPASAITQSQLVAAGFNAEQAAIVLALLGSSNTQAPAASCMTYGLPGVSGIQTAVNALGYTPALAVDGAMGPMTRAGVRWAQALVGTSVDGAWGPMTQAAYENYVAANCVVEEEEEEEQQQPGGSTGSTTLSGDGSLEIQSLFQADIELKLGQADVALELELEAEEGDIAIDRVEFNLSGVNNNLAIPTLRPWLYFSEINLWMDGSKVSTLSGQNDFSSNTPERVRFSGLNYVIEEGEKVDLAIEFKSLSALAGNRSDAIMSIVDEEIAIRYFNGLGLYSEDTEAFDVEVSFDDTLGEGEINVILSNNSPQSANIVLNETSRVNGVTVANFEVEAKDSSVKLDNIVANFATEENDTEDVLYRAYLKRGSVTMSQKPVNGTSVTFDNLNFVIAEDDIREFSIVVDFNRGDTLYVCSDAQHLTQQACEAANEDWAINLPETFTVGSVEVNAEGSDFTIIPTETLDINEDHQLFLEGLVAELTSKTQSTFQAGDATLGQFAFTFDVTAYGKTFYFRENGNDFGLSMTNDANIDIVSVSVDSNASLVNQGQSYQVNNGQTVSVTLTVQVEADAAGTQSTRLTIDDMTFYTNSGHTTGQGTFSMGAPEFRAATPVVVVDPAMQ